MDERRDKFGWEYFSRGLFVCLIIIIISFAHRQLQFDPTEPTFTPYAIDLTQINAFDPAMQKQTLLPNCIPNYYMYEYCSCNVKHLPTYVLRDHSLQIKCSSINTSKSSCSSSESHYSITS